MSQTLISIFLNGWLVVAVGLFIAIVWAVFRPGARAAMDLHARIPLDDATPQDNGGQP